MAKKLYKYVPFSFAIWTMIVINSFSIIFHVLVLFKIIPFDIVWAGKLKNINEMFVFESVSIAINVILLFVLLVSSRFIKIINAEKIVLIILWIFIVVFFLNTIGNIFSKTNLEKFIATPLTFISCLLCYRLTFKN